MNVYNFIKFLLSKSQKKKIKKSIIIPYNLQSYENFSITKSIQNHFELNVFNSDDIGFFELNEIFPQWFLVKNKSVNIFPLNKLSSFEHSKAKSWNQYFSTIYEFGEYVYAGKKWTFNQCINHVLLENSNKILNLTYFKWNNRFHWHNNGSSHHMACAYYHNENQNLNCHFDIHYDVTANIGKIEIKEVTLNKDEIQKTLENFEIFLVPNQLIISLNNLFGWEKSLKIKNNGMFLENNFSIELKILILHRKIFHNFIKEISENDFYKQYFFNYKKIIKSYL